MVMKLIGRLLPLRPVIDMQARVSGLVINLGRSWIAELGLEAGHQIVGLASGPVID